MFDDLLKLSADGDFGAAQVLEDVEPGSTSWRPPR